MAKSIEADAKSKGVDISKDISLDPKVIGTKVAALEHAMGQLIGMHQVNHNEIRQAFALTDAHLWVLKQLVTDIVSDTVIMIEGGVKAVDISAYYDLFTAYQKKQTEEAEAAKAAGDKEPKAPVAAAGDADVFGDGALGSPEEGVANVTSP